MKTRLLVLLGLSLLLTSPLSAKSPLFFKNHKKVNSSLRSSEAVRSSQSTRSLSPEVRPLYLPTTAYRVNISSPARPEKYEYSYDNYGHIISDKRYHLNVADASYILDYSKTYNFHRLPNGEFVITLDESLNNSFDNKYSSEYDNKGMMLWQQYEFQQLTSGNPSGWVLSERIEAVLNNEGIRTALASYSTVTENMVINDRYTFDSKGRITRITYDEDEWDSYVWNDDNQIVEALLSYDDVVMGLKNITTVLNGEYLNPYSLDPGSNEPEGWYSGDDYTLHQWFYNADFILGPFQGTARTTINDAKDEMTLTLAVEGNVMTKTTLKILDNYGSYSASYEGTDIFEEEEDYNETTVVQYNQYGELIRNYYLSEDIDGTWQTEEVYTREYDNNGRPLKTTYFYNGTKEYEETYDAWTGFSGIPEKKLPEISLYPNPSVDYVVISGAEKADVTVSDLQGRTIYKQTNMGANANISTTGWAQGVYLVTLQTGNSKITQKLIKQ